MKKIYRVFAVLGIAFYSNLMYAQWTPAVFEGTSYTSQPLNYSTMRNSLQQQESRASKASELYSELCKIVGKKRMLISNDRETLEWFSNNIQKKMKDVQDYIAVGDYHNAINRATEALGEIESNTELMRRIQTYEEYKEIVNYVENHKDLTYQEKREWTNTYKYKFVPMYNTRGELIGAYNWRDIGGPNNTPVIIP